MRIAIAATGLGHVTRGIEAWATELGRALYRRGHWVRLFKGGGSPEAPYERVIPCWQRNAQETRRLLHWLPRRLSWRIGLGSGYDIEQTTFALRLLSDRSLDDVDILHVQDPLLALIMQRAKRLGLVRTQTILGHATEESFPFLAKFDYVQHLAPWHMEQARLKGVWKPTWTTIPYFIDTRRFAPEGPSLRRELEIPDDAMVVLTAAAIKRGHKRVDHLIAEFSSLLRSGPDRNAYLVISGARQAETDDLVRWGHERLGGRIRFLVSFPRDRMPDLYRTANVFTLCSLFEMLPNALLEAAATGIPCLVHRHPVLEGEVGDGGRSIDMAAPGVLAAAMATLLDDRQDCYNLGQRARRHCLDHFSEERVVGQILDYYRFVVTNRRPRLCMSK